MIELIVAGLVLMLLHPWVYAVPISSIVGYNCYKLLMELEETEGK